MKRLLRAFLVSVIVSLTAGSAVLLEATGLFGNYPSMEPVDSVPAQSITSNRISSGEPFEMRTIEPGDDLLRERDPLPSPDGSFILYHHRDQLIIRNWTTGRERVIPKLELGDTISRVAWSPDSKYVAFNQYWRITDSTGAITYGLSDVHVISIETASIKTIPATANAHELSWSPDSRKLALLVLPEGRYENPEKQLEAAMAKPGSPAFHFVIGVVRVIDVATAAAKEIGSASPWADFTWSPDSSSLAFIAWQISGKGNEVHVVTIGKNEGRTFSFPELRQYSHAILGTSIPPLPMTPGTSATVGLRATGGYGWTTKDKLAFSMIQGSSWNFYLMSVSTGELKKICSEPAVRFDAACHSITPDGAYQFFTERNSHRLMLLNNSTSGKKPLMKASAQERFLLASPDARLVVFASRRDQGWGLYVAPTDLGQIANPLRIASLSAKPSKSLGAWWTPSGRLVLGLGFSASDIYRVAMDQTGHAIEQPQSLTDDEMVSFAPSVSPDGEHIAYWRTNGSQSGLTVIDKDGDEERILLEYPIASENAPQLEWRSEKEILFYNAATGEDSGFIIVNIETGQVLRKPFKTFKFRKWAYLPQRNKFLASPSSGNPKSEFPLNALDAAIFSDLNPPVDSVIDSPLVFRNFGRSNNFVMRFAKTVLSALKLNKNTDIADRTIHGMDDKDVVLDFTISPDGRRIAYLHADQRDLEKLKDQIRSHLVARIPLEIRLMSLDGTGMKTLLKFQDFEPLDYLDGKTPELRSFSPDGKFVLYADQRGKPCVIDAETGKHWPLLSLNGNWKSARWSKDGSIVLAESDSIVEWRSWEGVTYNAVLRLMGLSPKK
jgi:Tol biopolymer transport system component